MTQYNHTLLFSYRVTLDESTLPEGYGVTKYRVNDKDESSKLTSEGYELVSNEENQFKDSQEPYIIMAEKTDDTSVPYYVEGYDVIENQSVEELNGGITKFQKGTISGTIFDDKDYNGLLGEEDQGYKDITVILTQYQKVAGKDEYISTGNTFTSKTNKHGKYTFKDVETNGMNEENQRVLDRKSVV